MCVEPITGYRTASGKVTMDRKVGYYDRPVEVACGQCVECRLLRRSDWIVRNVHESQYYAEFQDRGSCFLTLTYDNENMPSDAGLHVYDMQWFLYRLRTWLRREKRIEGISYYYTGEYGTRSNRPHWHMLLFGYDFRESRIFKGLSPEGHRSYLSDDLMKLWPKGHSELGSITVQSVGYCTGYISVDQKEASDRFIRRSDVREWRVRPEFSRMSLRPAIGKRWWEHYGDSVCCAEEVWIDGKFFPIPKYYLSLIKDQAVVDRLQKRRIECARSSLAKGEVSARFAGRREARATRQLASLRPAGVGGAI